MEASDNSRCTRVHEYAVGCVGGAEKNEARIRCTGVWFRFSRDTDGQLLYLETRLGWTITVNYNH